MRFIDRKDFSEKILPALNRALLRSPENVLEGITYMFNDIKIDLGDFAKDLIPTLGKQLIVKTEQTQLDAVKCIKAFVLQCSSFEAIAFILNHLFAILSGSSEGKLTLPIQKNMVLTAISNCSYNASFSSQECNKQLLDLFNEFFKIEANDLTLHFAFEQLRICLQNTKITNFQGEFLAKIKTFFKSLLDNKTFSTAFKIDIYHSMISIYSICEANNEIKAFESYCLKSIEKAQSQVTQNQITSTEALSASLLLVTYLESDSSFGNLFYFMFILILLSVICFQLIYFWIFFYFSESKCQSFIESVNDESKQLFTNEKFFRNINELGAKVFCDFFEKLMLVNYSKETFNLRLVQNFIKFNYVNVSVIESLSRWFRNKIKKWLNIYE